MATWKLALADAGATSVTTLGASGNAVVDLDPAAEVARLEQRLEQTLERRAGIRTPHVVRAAADWEQILRGNPFAREVEREPGYVQVLILKGEPGPGAWVALREAIVGRERLEARSTHAYLVYPDGVGRSKLTPTLMERKLGVPGTMRNWNTARKLGETLRS